MTKHDRDTMVIILITCLTCLVCFWLGTLLPCDCEPEVTETAPVERTYIGRVIDTVYRPDNGMAYIIDWAEYDDGWKDHGVQLDSFYYEDPSDD